MLPASTDMNLYGGIYREAELILTGKTAVSPLHLGSEGVLVRQNSVTSALVEGEAEIYLTSAGESTCMLTLDITAPDGRKVFTKRQKTRLDGRPVVIPFSIADPQLWRRKLQSRLRVIYLHTESHRHGRRRDKPDFGRNLQPYRTAGQERCADDEECKIHRQPA